MKNNTQIFTSQIPDILVKFKKRIITARVIIFILAGLCLLIALTCLIMGYWVQEKNDAAVSSMSFGSIGIFYLVLGFISFRRPYIFILITAFINLLFFLCMLVSLVNISNLPGGLYYCIAIAVQFLIAFFLFRGAIFANRYKKLIRNDNILITPEILS